MNPQHKNIYQVNADDIKEDGLLDYIKSKHKQVQDKDYIMIDFSKVQLQATTQIEILYLQMLQYCANMGNSYLQIMLNNKDE